MFKKLVIPVAVFAVILTGCGGKKAAYNYSQDIVAKERALEPQITLTENKVEEFAGAEKFDSVAAVAGRMETLVQKTIDEVDAMKVPKAKEADSFKAAIMRYFKFIKSIYTGYKKVGEATTAEDRQKLAQDLLDLAGQKNDEITKMQSSQKKYAEANGFKVEN